MKYVSARDAKNCFGKLIDAALVAPVTIEKHGRPVVVVLSVEKFEKLNLKEKNEGDTSYSMSDDATDFTARK